MYANLSQTLNLILNFEWNFYRMNVTRIEQQQQHHFIRYIYFLLIFKTMHTM